MATRQSIGEDKELILQDKQDDIERLMDIDEVLVGFLKIGHIDQREFSQIKSPLKQKDKVQTFISHLCTRGPRAYESFISLLKNSDKQNHQSLADILENRDSREPVTHVPQPDDCVAKGIAKSRREREVDSKLHDHEKRIHTLEVRIEQPEESAEFQKLKRLIEEKERELKDTKERLEKQQNISNSSIEENQKLKERVQTLERELQETRKNMEMWKAEAKALQVKIDDHERINKEYRDKVDQLVAQMEAFQKPAKQTKTTIQPANRFQRPSPAQTARPRNRQANQQATTEAKEVLAKNK